MTTHLFAGYHDGTTDVVTDTTTLCCNTFSLGLPKGDQGTVEPDVADCPVPTSMDAAP